MSTIITRLDAKTLEARKGQVGRSTAAYMNLLQEIARLRCAIVREMAVDPASVAQVECTSCRSCSLPGS